MDSVASVNAQNVPKVTHGKRVFVTSVLYVYVFFVGLLYTLADCVGRGERGKAFRSLQHGFNHWSSGRLSKMEIIFRHPKFCHVHCQVTPLMNQGLYILLDREGWLQFVLPLGIVQQGR